MITIEQAIEYLETLSNSIHIVDVEYEAIKMAIYGLRFIKCTNLDMFIEEKK